MTKKLFAEEIEAAKKDLAKYEADLVTINEESRKYSNVLLRMCHADELKRQCQKTIAIFEKYQARSSKGVK